MVAISEGEKSNEEPEVKPSFGQFYYLVSIRKHRYISGLKKTLVFTTFCVLGSF
jgi:hypothetical protein